MVIWFENEVKAYFCWKLFIASKKVLFFKRYCRLEVLGNIIDIIFFKRWGEKLLDFGYFIDFKGFCILLVFWEWKIN